MKLLNFHWRGQKNPGVDGLEGELRGPRWVLHMTMLSTIVFFLWAYFFEIDQVARAPGVVMPSSKIQIIQSKDGGVLLTLPVNAGDEVAEGQVIARFDQTDALASYEDAKAKAASLAANMARLEAEIYQKPNFSFSKTKGLTIGTIGGHGRHIEIGKRGNLNE